MPRGTALRTYRESRPANWRTKTLMAVRREVQLFFEAFARNSSALDVASIGEQFADTFMSADPRQAIAVPKAAFLGVLPHRQAMFDDAGVTSIDLLDVDTTALDDRHVLAATRWAARRKAGGSIPLASTFILRRQDDSFVVIFYLNHQDLTEVLQP